MTQVNMADEMRSTVPADAKTVGHVDDCKSWAS